MCQKHLKILIHKGYDLSMIVDLLRYVFCIKREFICFDMFICPMILLLENVLFIKFDIQMFICFLVLQVNFGHIETEFDKLSSEALLALKVIL